MPGSRLHVSHSVTLPMKSLVAPSDPALPQLHVDLLYSLCLPAFSFANWSRVRATSHLRYASGWAGGGDVSLCAALPFRVGLVRALDHRFRVPGSSASSNLRLLDRRIICSVVSLNDLQSILSFCTLRPATTWPVESSTRRTRSQRSKPELSPLERILRLVSGPIRNCEDMYLGHVRAAIPDATHQRRSSRHQQMTPLRWVTRVEKAITQSALDRCRRSMGWASDLFHPEAHLDMQSPRGRQLTKFSTLGQARTSRNTCIWGLLPRTLGAASWGILWYDWRG
jgi:hypothetical protein